MGIGVFHVWKPTGEYWFSSEKNKSIYPIDIYSEYDIWTYGTLIYGLVVIIANLRIVFSY